MGIQSLNILVPKKALNKKTTTITLFFGTLFILTFILSTIFSKLPLLSPLAAKDEGVGALKPDNTKNQYEVFGFAPHWTLHRLDNIDFTVLTTLAYFGLPIDSDGSIDKENIGTTKFHSDRATQLFKKAHQNGTRVVLTITQMDNDTILALMDDQEAQERAISESVDAVVNRGIDGINVDFEFVGNPGSEYRNKFTKFVKNMTTRMHRAVPHSKVTVSVYASAAKHPKIYDIKALGQVSDGIFMMAYDFATTGSDNVIPTAPLYGHKEGKYWYDISTAVEDFLAVMPKEKLILGLPWYGYDYPVAVPSVKAVKDTGYYTSYWYRGRKYKRFVARPKAHASTYAAVLSNSAPKQEGWDEYGQVGWKAYQDNDGWRMLFLDDVKSLGIKYDFAKEKGLGGVGMWALGFDHGNTDMWQLLSLKFGKKLVDNRIANNSIYE